MPPLPQHPTYAWPGLAAPAIHNARLILHTELGTKALKRTAAAKRLIMDTIV